MIRQQTVLHTVPCINEKSLNTFVSRLSFFVSQSFRGLVFLHETNPIHFIIDTAPIVLGTLAFYLGKSKAAIERQYKELLITTQFRDQFFANMSHELRTPMNGVTGIVFIIR